VNYIASELLAECVVIGKFIPGVDKEKTDALMVQVLNLQDEFIKRISHTEPGNVKGFYKKFREDFNAQVNAVIEGLEKLH
jgi:hypothetical protein